MATSKKAYKKSSSEPKSDPGIADHGTDLSSIPLETLTERIKALESDAAVYKTELQVRREKKAQELIKQHEKRWSLLVDALVANPTLVDILCPKHRGDCSDNNSSVCLYLELDEDHICPRCMLLELLRDGCTEYSISLDFSLGIVGRYRPGVGF